MTSETAPGGATTDRLERARVALEGLSTGDAFGEQLLHAGPHKRATAVSDRRHPSASQWRWTDDTAMAISIVEVLERHAGIDEEALARRFATRYGADPARGYGRGAHEVLEAIRQGTPYREAAQQLFGGQGSCGNGGGMRSAPIGAYFADDLAAVVVHAARSAVPTHAHPHGVAGAVAIAIAAARTFAGERDPRALIEAVVAHTPPGPTRDGLRRARDLVGADPVTAATDLGNGSRVISADTVPFAVWCAASHLADYGAALWACVSVGGDIDTTCAMVGGIVVGALGLDGIPAAWRAAREPLA
ncbi:MAG TPA: ADP-ribosylglycohydrolase family protein [Kofleriaceae bacterium]|nr:ADP-ribosylglycohydrolase family protein [Kofleriaceae bacterium]